MGLSQFIVDIGRPVAYYPSLKKIACTTTASILLCQLLYWSDKSSNEGWIYKTSEQLEEETGLSYDEQRTARAKLKELNLVEERYDRINHEMWYKVNQETMNARWEGTGGEKTKEIVKEEKPTKKEEVRPKKDFLDLIVDQREWVGFKQGEAKNVVRSKIATRLRVNPDGKRWETFIEYATNRELKHNEPVDKFIDWAITEGFNPIYWTPEKMMTMYPQAFTVPEKAKEKDTFISKLPEIKEENYVPMPARKKIE